MKKVLAVIGAAAAGFVTGILTAPKSGKETRQDLKKKAGEMKAATEKTAQKAKQAAVAGAQSLKEGAMKMGGVASDTAHDVKADVKKHVK